jgi:hypothetical protein
MLVLLIPGFEVVPFYLRNPIPLSSYIPRFKELTEIPSEMGFLIYYVHWHCLQIRRRKIVRKIMEMMEEESSKTKRAAFNDRRDFLDVVLSWSLENIYDENLYKNQVQLL